MTFYHLLPCPQGSYHSISHFMPIPITFLEVLVIACHKLLRSAHTITKSVSEQSNNNKFQITAGK